MKKKTNPLLKLVKQAIRAVILEFNDPEITKEYLPKYEDLNLNERNKLRNDILREEQKERRVAQNREDVDIEKLEKVYEFLLDSSKKEIPLRKLLPNPILTEKGVNISTETLKNLYNDISTLAFDEFQEIVMAGMVTCDPSCTNGCTNFSPITIYGSDCSLAVQITDNFICCSGENPNNAAIGTQVLYNIEISPGNFWPVAGNIDCYDMGSATTFDYDDFTDYVIGNIGGNAGSPNPGPGSGAGNASTIMTNWWTTFLTPAGTTVSCEGCVHPGQFGGADVGAIGCDNSGQNNFDPTDLSCCDFRGCGVVNPIGAIYPLPSNPDADNTATVTVLGTNYTITAVANEELAYWTDDNSCDFSTNTYCLTNNINISTPCGPAGQNVPCTAGIVSFQTENPPPMGGSITGVTCDSTYDYQAAGAPNPSPYCTANNGQGATISGGGCEVQACTDSTLSGITDSLGNLLWTSYSGLSVGATANYIVVDDGNNCEVQGCFTPGYANSIASGTYPNAIETNIAGLCVTSSPGCNVVGWTNYNASATSMDNSCVYEGCADQAYASSNTYVCKIYPWMCELGGGGVGSCTCTANVNDPACEACVPNVNHPDASNSSNPFQHIPTSCFGINGCMDNGDPMTNPNYNFNTTTPITNNQEWWDGVGDNTFNYASSTSVASYPGIAATNYSNVATVEDGSCTYGGAFGCTNVGSCNYSPTATQDDGSCTGTLVDCVQNTAAPPNGGTYPYLYVNYDPNQNPPTFCDTNADQTTNNCVACVYGCTDPASSNYDALATCDDGGCQACIYGCYDQPSGIGSLTYPQVYSNWDPNATCDDGSCIACVYGCTDPTADNENPNATCDDGSCTYTYGCSADPTACNYQANVIDDGSCEYDSCAGCMDDGTGANPGTNRPNNISPTNAPACNLGYNNLGTFVGLGQLTIDNPGLCEYVNGTWNQNCVGCTDSTACNPDNGTIIDDGSCTYPPGPTCDCNGNIVGPYCDCNGDTTTCLDLCGTLNGPCTTFNTLAYGGTQFGVPSNGTCPDGNGGDYCSCANEYTDCAGVCNGTSTLDPSGTCCEDNVKDCQGTCNGTFSVDICGVCLDQNDPNRDICVDCNGTPNGPALQDDCGICHPNPSNPPNTTPTWNDTCSGCTWDQASNTTNGATIDDGTCSFAFCGVHPSIYSGGVIDNYICGVTQDDLYELCEEDDGQGGYAICTAACPDGVPRDPSFTNYLGTTPTHPITAVWNWYQNSCSISTYGCLDNGGQFFTSGISPNFTNGEANNYNAAAGVACVADCGPDPTDSANASVNLSTATSWPGKTLTADPNDPGIGTTHTYAPDGCCCRYSPGCIDDDYVEYETFYKQSAPSTYSDGSTNLNACQTLDVQGCMQPGATNFDPTATSDPNNTCYYEGCVDNGNHYDTICTPAQATVSPWDPSSYVCTNQTPVAGATNAAGNAMNVGEWLCNCDQGNNTGQPACSLQSEWAAGPYNTQFKDGTTFDSSTGLNNYDYYDCLGGGQVAGSCQATAVNGCLWVASGTAGTAAGGPGTYNQVSGGNTTFANISQPPYNPNATAEDGSCVVYACEIPEATNYFCNDTENALYCTSDQTMWAPGCPSSAAQGTLCLSSVYASAAGGGALIESTQASTPYDCEFDGFNCDGDDGCVQVPPGSPIPAQFPDLAACQAECIQCTQVTAKRCNGTVIKNYNCGGAGADGLMIDSYHGDMTITGTSQPVTSPYGIGQIFKIKEKLLPAWIEPDMPGMANPGGELTGGNEPKGIREQLTISANKHDYASNSTWVTYEVTSIQTVYGDFNTSRDVPSHVCIPPTWDCCSFSTCPDAWTDFVIRWNQNNPGQPTPSVNAFHKFCYKRTDGTGAYNSLNQCNINCPGMAHEPKDKTYVGPTPVVGPGGDDEAPGGDDVTTLEPKDIRLEPTGSQSSNEVPELPFIVPDTPDITESKRLRKLLKKWKRNNL